MNDTQGYVFWFVIGVCTGGLAGLFFYIHRWTQIFDGWKF